MALSDDANSCCQNDKNVLNETRAEDTSVLPSLLVVLVVVVLADEAVVVVEEVEVVEEEEEVEDEVSFFSCSYLCRR